VNDSAGTIRWNIKTRFKRLLPAKMLVVSVLLTACTVGPNYRPPNPKIPDHWIEQAKSSTAAQQDWSRWWRGFNDTRLNRLIERALRGNLDVQMAESRIQAARAQIIIAESQRWPHVGASSAFQRQRISPNALLGALGSIQGGSNSSGLLSTIGPIGKPFNLFQAGFDSSWELDLFGGLRRQQEAATAQAEAIEESLRDVQVSLTAEVARQYLELAALHRQLTVAQERLTDAHALERLMAASFQEGLATGIDRRQAKTARETVESSIAPLEAQIKSIHHALALLLGLEPGALDRELVGVTDIPDPPAIQPGLPADLLRRRPDIRQAERRVAAASASIGVAVAELFPKLSLTGVAGFQSQDLSNFTNWSSGFYGFGPRLSLPIFQAGRLRANIEVQEAGHREALTAYQKTVLSALREVESGLAEAKGEQERLKSLDLAEQESRKAFQGAAAFYQEGEIDLTQVLEKRRDWHDARDRLIQSRLAWATVHVALIKALGGGW
jgi:NodT family efflux transporter outer membrane factor (OMF) lipoprotein